VAAGFASAGVTAALLVGLWFVLPRSLRRVHSDAHDD
jgi:hypothetical protein